MMRRVQFENRQLMKVDGPVFVRLHPSHDPQPMKTALDDRPYYRWHLSHLNYSDGVLSLDVRSDSQSNASAFKDDRYLVVFSDVVFHQVFDECMQKKDEGGRAGGTLGLHQSSSLLTYLRDHTAILHCVGNDVHHYSLLTALECVHIITRGEPKLTQID